MRLDPDRVKKHCARNGVTLTALLDEAGVSRTAYYSLARRDSVLPGTVRAIAGALGVASAAILDEEPPLTLRTQALVRQARRILARNPGASFENVWHTLVLLEEPPIERLRRSLRRGRAAADFL